jgi:5-methylcytosine-specific restriction protein A
MMRNARPPVFRPPWAPDPVQRLAAWREEQRRRHPQASRQARGYDKDWEELRAAHLDVEPNCRHCAQAGVTRRAVIVDHIEPIRSAPERRLDPSNLQSLCGPHHRRKTNRYDGGFGRPRAGEPGRFILQSQKSDCAIPSRGGVGKF